MEVGMEALPITENHITVVDIMEASSEVVEMVAAVAVETVVVVDAEEEMVAAEEEEGVARSCRYTSCILSSFTRLSPIEPFGKTHSSHINTQDLINSFESVFDQLLTPIICTLLASISSGVRHPHL
jgi:hypothetical protein